MDLLGDIGATDQLTAARSENAVLQTRVKELSMQVKVLTVENESLKAEVEIYRQEAALPSFSNMALGKSIDEMVVDDDEKGATDHFVKSGNGVFPKQNDLTFSKMNGNANPLCCALSPDDSVMAIGGADASVRLSTWGAALNPSVTAEVVVQNACSVPCSAPVISVSFSPTLRNLLATGAMDGSVQLCHYQQSAGTIQILSTTRAPKDQQHRKYVRNIVWSPTKPVFASASADGSVHLYTVTRDMGDFDKYTMTQLSSLHLSGAVEAMTFTGGDMDELVCYARGTPYLSYFDLNQDLAQRKVNLNAGITTGGFSDHVSFCVMNLIISPDRKYLAAATDAARNIILDAKSGKIVRNLYGHNNDGYSQPVISWSSNGQYVLGNSQNEAQIIVWDVASSNIVARLEGHGTPVRSLYSSTSTDLLVTTGFDKQTKLWFAPSAMM